MVLVAATLLMLGGSSVGPAAAQDADTVRTMSWNLNTRNFSPDDWIKVIGNQKPDIIGVQEVCVREAEQLRENLKDDYGLDYKLVVGSVREYRDFNYENLDDWGALDGECSRWWPFARGAYGQAILTRLDIVEGSHSNRSLPVAAEEEARGYTAVDVRTRDGRTIRAYNAHLSTGGEMRRQQVEVIAADAREHATAVALGDLNVRPDEVELLAPLTRDFVDVVGSRNRPTAGNDHTKRNSEPTGSRLDYIYIRGLDVVGEPETYWVASSDHRPLIANLR